jgi:plasmid stabilization system protein ParE
LTVEVLLTDAAIADLESIGDYLVFYRVTGSRVEILHVLHGARDYELLLYP